MLNKPKFTRCFHVEIVEPESIFLLSERNFLSFSGRLYQLLTSLIDSHRSVDEIVDEILPHLLTEKQSAKDVISASFKVLSALVQMEQKGYIVETDDHLPPALAVFCDT